MQCNFFFTEFLFPMTIFFGPIKIHDVNKRSKLLESFNRTSLLLISHCEPMPNKSLLRLYTNRIYQTRRIPTKRKQQPLFLSAFLSKCSIVKVICICVSIFVCGHPVRPVLRIIINTLDMSYATMTVKPDGKFLREIMAIIIALLTKS